MWMWKNTDIVMGTSGRGAGVGMMPQPELVADTFSLLAKHSSILVTGKNSPNWNPPKLAVNTRLPPPASSHPLVKYCTLEIEIYR